MKVQILLFAQLKDTHGSGSLWLELPSDSTVADAVARLGESHPQLVRQLEGVAYAVDEAYCRPDTVLRADQTLALIPPVSGG